MLGVVLGRSNGDGEIRIMLEWFVLGGGVFGLEEWFYRVVEGKEYIEIYSIGDLNNLVGLVLFWR